MSLFLYVAETVASVRSKIVGYMQAGGSTLSNWIAGGIGQQIVESVANSTQGFTSIAAKLSRGFASLDTSTDPGDVDTYDADNQTLAPAPGLLSDLGSNFYGTERIGATPATGSLTFANTGTGNVNQNLPVLSVTFQRDSANSDGSVPTYRNSAPIVCAAGVILFGVPIVADLPGSASNATAGHVINLVTVLPGVTVTNPAAVVGTDLQSADEYRAACREAEALTSPNGPADAYRYLATTGRDDGTWGNSTTGNSLGITRIYVPTSSSTGIVTVYYAGAAGGAAIAGSVAAANALITLTPGVISVPDATTFSGAAATDVTVAVTYTVKAKASSVPGGIAGTYPQGSQGSAAPVFAAIEAALPLYLATVDIGGNDQTAGAGTLYADEIRSQIAATWPTTYHTTLTAPSGDVSLAVGHVATFGVHTGTVILT